MTASVIYILVTKTKKKAVDTAKTIRADKNGKKSKSEYLENLIQFLCIWYPITFRKKFMLMLVLFDTNSEINAIHSIFAQELGLFIKPTDVRALKIDSSILDNFGIIVVVFLVTDKTNQIKFFKEIFLVANVSLEVVLGMFFLTLSCTDVDFLDWELRWRTYTIKEALSTTKCIEPVGKKEFVGAMLDSEHKSYIVYVGSVSSVMFPNFSSLNVHPSHKP